MATLVQTVNPSVSTGTITASLTATLQGSLILVFNGMSGIVESVSTVTDNAGNLYTKADSVALGSGGDTELWYAKNADPTTSVVITFSGSTLTKSIFVREYSGMDRTSFVFDRTASTSGSGTSVSSGATSSTQTATELVVCSATCLGTNPTLSVGAGFGNFTSQTILAGTSLHAIEDQTVTSIGTQTGIMTAGGTLPVWDVEVSTFVISPGRGMVFNPHVTVGNGESRSEIAN